MSNDNNKDASTQIYEAHLGSMGVQTGSNANSWGYSAYEQEKRYKKQKESWSSPPTSSSGSSSKLICNQLLNSGEIDQAQFITSMRDFRERLTPTHLRGYHVWAVPTVRLMRKSKTVSNVVHKLFNMRMKYVESRNNRKVSAPMSSIVLCKLGEGLSYILGAITPGNQNWQRVYDKKHKPAVIDG